jgi:SNF2 family DNA or RNA helicase
VIEQITQVAADGHKALVFSQFTSLLDIVRRRLDKQKIRYAYLDGKTTIVSEGTTI